MYHYPVTLDAFYISQAHNYFGNRGEKPLDNPVQTPDSLVIETGKGIVGDRFYGIKEDYDGQVTFINSEVIDTLQQQNRAVNPELFRRNILISGIAVVELIGKEFRIGDLLFKGVKHCAPCKWMDRTMGKGTMKAMQGRGGLRAKVLQGGSLHLGMYDLQVDLALSYKPLQSLPKPNLP